MLSNYNCQIKHCGQEVFEDAPSVGSGRYTSLHFTLVSIPLHQDMLLQVITWVALLKLI